MALNSPLIMNFRSSLFRMKPKTLVGPPQSLSFSIQKLYRISPLSQSIKAKSSTQGPIIRNLRNTAIVIVFAASMIGKFQNLDTRAEGQSIQTEVITNQDDKTQVSSCSPVPQFTGSNSGVIEALHLVMNQNYESGDYEECLKISEELVSAQPENLKWKIAMAKVLKQMGESKKALDILDEVLSKNPLEPHALFESSVWRSFDGQEEEAIIRLEKALQIATKKNNATELRDVRLVICQVKFLQKKVDEALRGFHELEKEDPTDVRIYFCKGLLFYCTERNAEATEQFDKYYELLPNATQSDEGYMTTYTKMRPPGI